MPSRDEVLAIDCAEAAFDHSTQRVTGRDVRLIRAALSQDLILLTEHAINAADDEGIDQGDIWSVIEYGQPTSKDLPDNDLGRPVGINFEHRISGGRQAVVKVSWEDGYFVATIYTL